MPYSQGCLFVEAYLESTAKKFGDPQLAGASITYSGAGTATWSPSQAVLLDLGGTNLGVSTGLLTGVFGLTGSGTAGSVAIDMGTLLSYESASLPAKKAAYKKIWDAFSGNGRIILTAQTSVGAQDIRIELRALKSSNYSLTANTRSACPSYPGGCGNPNFNFTGESANNYTAEFLVPSQSNLPTASFAPDDFSIPNGDLPSPSTYSATLALTRAFSTDSSGNSVTPYTVACDLPSNLQVTS